MRSLARAPLAGGGADTGDEAAALFSRHYELIVEVIRQVVRRRRVPRDEAEDFAGDVIVRLLEDDCAVLRRFEGRSQLRTFLLRVVDRMLLDCRIRRWGKWRPSARARRLGRVALLLDALTSRDRLTFDEAAETLRTNWDVAETPDSLWRLYTRLPARTRRRFVPAAELDALTATGLPPDRIVRRTRAARVRMALHQALTRLTPDERGLLEQRFARGLRTVCVAQLGGLEQKALYRQFALILRRLRSDLTQQGIDASDLADWALLAEPGPRPGAVLPFRRP
jgi:RNA polymerase sigma factor (sigma-70 family)